MTVVVRRSADRSREDYDGITTWHSLSAGAVYDPSDVSFGRMIAHDEHVLPPGTGFEPHTHRGLAIVTWVVRGTLTHRHGDEETPVQAGQLAYLLAGDGVEHSERNEGDEPVVFVQAWLLSEAVGDPVYGFAQNYGIAAEYTPPGGDARVVVIRAKPGQRVTLARQPFVHAHVASGSFVFGSEQLHPGDVLRAYDEAAVLVASEAGDLVTWSMSAGITPPRP